MQRTRFSSAATGTISLRHSRRWCRFSTISRVASQQIGPRVVCFSFPSGYYALVEPAGCRTSRKYRNRPVLRLVCFSRATVLRVPVNPRRMNTRRCRYRDRLLRGVKSMSRRAWGRRTRMCRDRCRHFTRYPNSGRRYQPREELNPPPFQATVLLQGPRRHSRTHTHQKTWRMQSGELLDNAREI